MKKYTNPDAHGYLLEAKACKQVIKDLRRIAEKYKRAVNKESAKRQSDFETAMQYTSERQIQDDYGWDIITQKQYEWYLDLFHNGQEALENASPTPNAVALNILYRIIGHIEAECYEWEFSALPPQEQAAELERQQKSQED